MASQVLLSSASEHAGYLALPGGDEPCAFRLRATEHAFEIDGCPRLRAALAGQEEAVEQRLRRAGADAHAVLAELAEQLEASVRASTADVIPPSHRQSLPPVAYYEQLVRELDAVGWGSLLSVSPGLDELQLRVDDAAGRSHTLALVLPAEYPHAPPRARVSLPVPFEVIWPSAEATTAAPPSAPLTATLTGVITQFRAALARHQVLWDMLDDLDAHAWVLEPKHPGRECASRRIALGDHCSLQLELHAAAPTSLPELQFYGADRVIAPLRQALNANLARWQPDRSVRVNLIAVLQRELPAPPSAAVGAAAAEAYATECAICYEYELEGIVPESACDSCSKPFHKACLSEWLGALPTTQQSFNRLFVRSWDSEEAPAGRRRADSCVCVRVRARLGRVPVLHAADHGRGRAGLTSRVSRLRPAHSTWRVL